jgi:hypothetical protein
MKHKRVLTDYIEEYKEPHLDDITVRYEDHLAELEYLAEISNCSVGDIKLVYVRAVGETVVYIEDRFYGYMDRTLINEMDRYYNSK